MDKTYDNVIKETTNYDQFKFLGANRKESEGHINNLKKSIEEYGNLTKVSPIILNEKFEIIDGQHRFLACKELGLPIFYTEHPGLTIEDARQMNILQRNWGPVDYAYSYATTGNKNYQIYLNLLDEYGSRHSTLLAYCYSSGRKDGINIDFKNGDFVVNDEKLTRELLDKLASVYEITDIHSRSIAYALLSVFQTEGYDHTRMLKKLIAHGESMKRFERVDDNVRQLEDVYNKGFHDENRLRFF